MDRGARRFIAGTAATGVTAAVLAAAVLPTEVSSPRTLFAFVVVAFVSGLLPLRFLRTGGQQGFNFEGAVLVGMLLTVPVGLVPLIMVAASLFTHALRRPLDGRKLLFNPGKTGLEMAAGAFAFSVLAPAAASPTDLRSVGAVVVASLAYEFVSTLVMSQLFLVLDATPRRETVRDVAGMSGVTFFGNTCFGLILAAVATVNTAFVLLSGLALAGLFMGYRGYATALGDRQRAQSLSELTHVMLDLPSGDVVIERLLSRLVEVFGARTSSLVLVQSSGTASWTHDDGETQKIEDGELPRTGSVAAAMARGRCVLTEIAVGDDAVREALVAPIGRPSRPIGAVSLVGRRGFEPWGAADASLLGAVANELTVALDNVSLFQQVEEERARLEAESTKLNNILGAATDGISSFLADGTIEAWNPGMARITGVPGDVAVGKPWHAVLRLKDADGVDLAPTGDHVVGRSLTGDLPAGPLPLQALRSDGEWRRLECTASPVRDPDGGHRGLVVVARDVTAERELEELKSDFIATVSHELRTPLTPLKGFLATLRNPRTALTDDQLDSVHGSMSTQLTRLEMLISDLLAVAELDHGQFNLYPEPLALGELVPEAVEVEAADQYARCTVTVDPDATAVADAVALVRVLRSLVSNAVKHTEGHVEVTVRTVEDRVEVAVADEGPGIASWDQQRVFNRFERLGNHLRRTQGPGLGLTIARALAQRMGGDVSVSSDIGRGAVFTLSLPRARPRALPPASASIDQVDEATS